MAIKVISPVNLDEGHLVKLDANGQMVAADKVLGGQVVKLVTSTDAQYGGELHIEVSKGTDALATATPYGFCYKASVAQPENNLYIPFNQYKAPLNRQSVVLTKGFRAEFWNDGTGAVFADDVFNAPAGTALYINANGLLTTTAGSADTVGSLVVASVEVAPADANGVLVAKVEL